MAITGKRIPSCWSDNLAPSMDYWNQPPSVLVRAALELPKALNSTEETISGLLGALDAKSPHTASHCLRVGQYAGLLATALDMPEAQVDYTRRSGLLHDVGKLGIPEGVLEKPGRLTADEWGLIKLHPIIGASILRGCPSMAAILPAIAMHHERWDGQGYPYGAKGAEIPVAARILAIADAFDTITSERPYKAPMAVEEACGLLLEAKGTQFEPGLVEIFIAQVVSALPSGLVTLSDPK